MPRRMGALVHRLPNVVSSLGYVELGGEGLLEVPIWLADRLLHLSLVESLVPLHRPGRLPKPSAGRIRLETELGGVKPAFRRVPGWADAAALVAKEGRVECQLGGTAGHPHVHRTKREGDAAILVFRFARKHVVSEEGPPMQHREAPPPLDQLLVLLRGTPHRPEFVRRVASVALDDFLRTVQGWGSKAVIAWGLHRANVRSTPWRSDSRE